VVYIVDWFPKTGLNGDIFMLGIIQYYLGSAPSGEPALPASPGRSPVHFYCKIDTGVWANKQWSLIKDAYLPAITVCRMTSQKRLRN